MADSRPAALDGAAAKSFLDASEPVKPHTKPIALLALEHFVIDVNHAFVGTRFLPAPRDAAA